MLCTLRQATTAGVSMLAVSAFLVLPSSNPALGDSSMKLSPQPASIMAAGSVLSAGAYSFGAGDRLKISFYDREDLTGVYRVRTSGQISLPFIGPISVAGKSLSQLEAEISDSFKKLTKRATFVNIEAVERRPVYVVGFVNKPGAYPFLPGMTVLHAVAVSGGVFRTARSATTNMNASRETWRRNSAVESLKRSLSHLSRLNAERDGLDKITPHRRLVQLYGQSSAELMLSSERRIFDQNKRSLVQRQKDLARAEELAETEIKAFRDQFSFLKEQEKLHNLELADTEKLQKKGLIRRPRVYQKRYQISNLKGKASEVIAAIARAERSLARTKRDRSMLLLDTQKRIENDIKNAQDQVERFELAIRAADDVIQQITGVSATMNRAATPVATYKIMRWSNGVYKIVDSAELTQLLPGDVIRVNSSNTVAVQPSPSRIQEASLVQKASFSSSPTQMKSFVQDSTQKLQTMLEQQRSALDKANSESRQVRQELESWKSQAAEMERKKAAIESEMKLFKESMKKLKEAKTVTKDMVSMAAPVSDSRALEADNTAKFRAMTLLKALEAKSPARSLAIALQTELDRVGCSPRYIDGLWGPESRSALARFNSGTKLSLSVHRATSNALKAVMAQKTSVCEGRQASANIAK